MSDTKFSVGDRVVIRTANSPISHRNFEGADWNVEYNGMTGTIDKYGAIQPDVSRWGDRPDHGFYWDENEVFLVVTNKEEAIDNLRAAAHAARQAGLYVKVSVTDLRNL